GADPRQRRVARDSSHDETPPRSPFDGLQSTGAAILLRAEHSVLRAVGHDELAQHSGVLRFVARAKPVDRDDVPLLDDVRRVAVADHPARRARLERPAHDFAALILDVEEEPRMRIREAHLDDLAGDRNRLVHVVERGERMMGRRRRTGAERQHSRGQRGCTYTLHNGPPRNWWTDPILSKPRGHFNRGTARAGLACARRRPGGGSRTPRWPGPPTTRGRSD